MAGNERNETVGSAYAKLAKERGVSVEVSPGLVSSLARLRESMKVDTTVGRALAANDLGIKTDRPSSAPEYKRSVPDLPPLNPLPAETAKAAKETAKFAQQTALAVEALLAHAIDADQREETMLRVARKSLRAGRIAAVFGVVSALIGIVGIVVALLLA